MESEKHQERWPFIGQSDVADVCQEICEAIVELERAFEAGKLSSRLKSGRANYGRSGGGSMSMPMRPATSG
jgi:hypothetical protein